MRTAPLFFLVAAIALAIGFSNAVPRQETLSVKPGESAKSSEVAPARSASPVIVELFTSEGCSDCPPADQLLYSLEQTQPVPGAEIIALEQHVDYWDEQGWRDPFSSPQFTLRQKDYVYALNLQTAYTPQMVVDGTAAFVGSDRNHALGAIAKAALIAKADLKIENLSGPNSVTTNLPLRIALESPPGAKYKHRTDVLLAVTEDYLASNVTRGENAGAHMNHLAVVRDLRVLGHVDSTGAFSAAPNLPLAKNWRRENLHIVAFVQDHSTKRILAASTLSLRGSTD